jgi:hypothetical protein
VRTVFWDKSSSWAACCTRSPPVRRAANRQTLVPMPGQGRLGQDSIHRRGPEPSSYQYWYYCSMRKQPVPRGGPRSLLHLLVSPMYSTRISNQSSLFVIIDSSMDSSMDSSDVSPSYFGPAYILYHAAHPGTTIPNFRLQFLHRTSTETSRARHSNAVP